MADLLKDDKRKRSALPENTKKTSADRSDGSLVTDGKRVDMSSSHHRNHEKDGDSNRYRRKKKKVCPTNIRSSDSSTSPIRDEHNGEANSSGDDTDTRTSSAIVKKIMIDVHRDMNEVVTMFGLVLHSAFDFTEDVLQIEHCGLILAQYSNEIIKILNQGVESSGVRDKNHIMNKSINMAEGEGANTKNIELRT